MAQRTPPNLRDVEVAIRAFPAGAATWVKRDIAAVERSLRFAKRFPPKDKQWVARCLLERLKVLSKLAA